MVDNDKSQEGEEGLHHEDEQGQEELTPEQRRERILLKIRQDEAVRVASEIEEDGNPVQEGTGATAHEVSQLLAGGFDLQRYELLEQSGGVEELTLKDLPQIARLYQADEIDDDALWYLHNEDWDQFRTYLQEGCFMDRWKTESGQELAELHQLNPNYVQSGEEFAQFMDGETVPRTRGSDFRIWGIRHPSEEKLLAVAAAFLPPKNDTVRMAKHAQHIREFFDSDEFYPRADTDMSELDVERTAEFYLIAAEKGFGVPAFEGMQQKLEEEGSEIDHWYLLRFAGLREVYPHQKRTVKNDNGNVASERMFQKLGFGGVGEHKDESCVIARTIQGGIVVVARVTWAVMHGDHSHVRDKSRRVTDELHDKAALVREANQ